MFYPETRDWKSHFSSHVVLNLPYFIDLYTVSLMPAHRHEYIELSLVVDGKGIQKINGNSYEMNQGALTLLMPFHIHKIIPTKGQIQMYNCMFDLHFLPKSSELHESLAKLTLSPEELSPVIYLDETHYNKIVTLFEEMRAEHKQQQVWSRDLLQIKLMEILIRFDRLRRHNKHAFHVTEHDRSNIWPIVYYVYAHYQEPISLSHLSDLFYISSPYLSSAFKKYTGLNFVQFLHEVRIRQACSLLASTDMSIIDISIETGFASPQSFIRVFRKIKGTPPNLYRRLKQSHSLTVTPMGEHE